MPMIRSKLVVSIRRFWLFAYHQHDARGGMHDFYDSYDTLVQAKAGMIGVEGSNFQIVDTLTGVVTEYC